MAIALVSNTSAAGRDGPVTTGSIDTTGATLLVINVASFAATTAPTITDSKSNTWIGLTQQVEAGGVARDRLFYAWNAIVGTGHTFTASGSTILCSFEVAAFSGVEAGSDPFDQQNGATGSGVGTIQPGSVTPSTNDQVVVTGLSVDRPTDRSWVLTASINSSFAITNHVDQADAINIGGAMAYLVQTSAAAVNPTWSYLHSNVNPASTIATFKAGGGGGGATWPGYISPFGWR